MLLITLADALEWELIDWGGRARASSARNSRCWSEQIAHRRCWKFRNCLSCFGDFWGKKANNNFSAQIHRDSEASRKLFSARLRSSSSSAIRFFGIFPPRLRLIFAIVRRSFTSSGAFLRVIFFPTWCARERNDWNHLAQQQFFEPRKLLFRNYQAPPPPSASLRLSPWFLCASAFVGRWISGRAA